jgi:predicted ATPase
MQANARKKETKKMKLESIRPKNFKAFKDVELKNIPRMCVTVGANGTGKSTLFSVFGFLKDSLTANVHVALTNLGGSRGVQEVRSRNTDGPSRLN